MSKCLCDFGVSFINLFEFMSVNFVGLKFKTIFHSCWIF